MADQESGERTGVAEPAAAPAQRVTIRKAVGTVHEVWIGDGWTQFGALVAVGSSLGDAKVQAVAELTQRIAEIWEAEP